MAPDKNFFPVASACRLSHVFDMSRWFIQSWDCLNGWRLSALSHAQAIKQSRMFPAWLAMIFVAIDFGILAVWDRCVGPTNQVQWLVSESVKFCLRLALVIGMLLLVCRRYRVSGQALGICPSNISSDLRWSLGLCCLGEAVVGLVIVAAFIAAVRLGIHLPAPSEFATQFLGGHRSFQYFILLGVCAVAGNLLVAVTEELLYRSLFLPALTSRLGLFPAVAVSSVVFGLAHVVPYGIVAIPLPQIMGGLLFAVGFSIRWSVVPAIIIHATGNMFACAMLFAYVRLFEAHPVWFRV